MAILQYSFDFYHSCTKHSNLLYDQQLGSQNQFKCHVVVEKFKYYFLKPQNIHSTFKYTMQVITFCGLFQFQRKESQQNIGKRNRSKMEVKEKFFFLNENNNQYVEINHIYNFRVKQLLTKIDNQQREQGFVEYDKNTDLRYIKKIQQTSIKLKMKRRFEILDLILSVLRFFMLTKSLKITEYQ
ncbi:unnamed protein product (macronuclear) [Paramecium tetraurelia]|uniref:Transmembrane protein n=1 Tax=Paramecium tetraurelia TaxID=5888 RepID=A0BSC0_PARTE|nr:uncharacterized protein GSPATT00031668001 [Paramecium tetraurelia]CAK61437.1 unnamed protein product [Paramecium tetraurelia]|eukprot:XP_001428835.1 hypothetical protein (macronuclear) [Paramecium tetraurelia strain d4-2]